jgi:hypothetical protein
MISPSSGRSQAWRWHARSARCRIETGSVQAAMTYLRRRLAQRGKVGPAVEAAGLRPADPGSGASLADLRSTTRIGHLTAHHMCSLRWRYGGCCRALRLRLWARPRPRSEAASSAIEVLSALASQKASSVNTTPAPGIKGRDRRARKRWRPAICAPLFYSAFALFSIGFVLPK